jgi:hypothetical protein
MEDEGEGKMRIEVDGSHLPSAFPSVGEWPVASGCSTVATVGRVCRLKVGKYAAIYNSFVIVGTKIWGGPRVRAFIRTTNGEGNPKKPDTR